MYRIILEDNIYYCEYIIQDGTERWTELTLEKAIESLIISAKVLNGSVITKEHIKFYRSESVINRKWIETKL